MTTPTSTKSQRILVIAGRPDEAQEWARVIDASPAEWVYVNSINMMRGRRYAPYVLIGTYGSRRDWPEIRDYLTIIQAVRQEG